MSEFTRATLIRMVRTMAQTAIATIGSAMVLSDVNWQMVASASFLAGVLSVLTSVATGLPEVDLEQELEDEDEDWYGEEDDMEVTELPDEDEDYVE